MRAGFSPGDFWRETPRSFVTIMEGAARAALERQEESIALAWHMAAFNAASKSKKGLQKLSHYLGKKPAARPQSTDEMLNVLREFQSRGAGMNIRRVN